MRTIAIYPGRFQPFGRNHKSAYDELTKIFGVENTYIATSNKIAENSPFSFNEKKEIIENFGIPKNNIILTQNPYKAVEITDKFNPDNTAVVFMYGKKDADRIKYTKKDGTSGYFQPYEENEILLPLNQCGYIFVSTGTVQTDNNETISGTLMREKLKNIPPSEFEKLMGWYNEKTYNLIKDKLNENINILKKEEMIYELLLNENGVSVSQLRTIEAYADALFKEFGIDIELQDAGRSHFFSRLNDTRNNPPITYFELRDLFRRAAKKYGKFLTTKYDGFSAVLKDMASNINIPFMISIDKKNDEIDLIPKTIMRKRDFLNRDKSLYLDEGYLIVEGGAAGHLMHPWDNLDLTFMNLQELITKALNGNLDSERYISEKPDGQNLLITIKDGLVLSARNKGTLQNPMSTQELQEKFANTPSHVQEIFVSAMQDMESALTSAPPHILQLFNNGTNFLNLEIIHPESRNVINYNLPPTIQLHGIFEYDENWNVKKILPEAGIEIVNELTKINACQQKTFKIISHTILKINDIPNAFDEEDKFISMLSVEMKKYNLNLNSTIDDYKVAKWEIIINERFPNIQMELKNILINRWARKISQRISNVDCGEFFDEINKFDKEESSKINLTILKPLELLFLSFGTLILKNIDCTMTVDRNDALSSLRRDLLSIIDRVEKSGDESLKNKLHTQLTRIEDIGGLTNLAPLEGLVFIYKGNEYKLTGLFAPINQIMGFFKYSNRK